MSKLIMTTAIGLAMLASPALAADATTTTGADAVGNQQVYPYSDRSRSYDTINPAPTDPHSGALAHPHAGPQGGSGDDGDGSGGSGDGDGAGAGAGGDGAGGSGGSGSGDGSGGS